VSTPLQTVHVRVNDAATGKPTPVRIRFTDADGNYYAPFGRLVHFALGDNEDVGGNVELGEKKYAYVDGSFEIGLRAGPVAVEISKGPEYWPRLETLERPAGKITLRFSIGRWADLRARGWYAGDTRLHFFPPHAALLEAAAEDVAVANLLAVETSVPTHEAVPAGPHEAPCRSFPAVPNLLAFSGQQPALADHGSLVAVKTHNRHPVLGTLGLLNCHRVVYPLAFGDEGGDNWTLAAWCDQCHRHGGLVIWTDACEHRAAAFGEALADAILGKIDAIEAGAGLAPDVWYALLNCGFHLPLAGGSGKRSNRAAVGAVRTYAQLLPDQELTYRHWIEAVRAGRTFVTRGPLVSLSVNGQGPGSVVRVPADAATVKVSATARSVTPFERLELILNGDRVADARSDPATATAPATAAIEAELDIPAAGWLAVRGIGGDPPHVSAHTSPVYVEREGQAPRPDPKKLASESFLQSSLDKTLEWVTHRARCDTDRQRAQLTEILWNAKHVLQHRAAGL
jgi:hypothetical protein